MKNKILLLVIFILLPIALISFIKHKTNFNLQGKSENQDSVEYSVKINKNGNTIVLNLEEYVIGVIAGEMPASFELEALKAQAIVSRSYVMSKLENDENNIINTDTSDQVYITKSQMQEKWQNDYEYYLEKITTAVNATKNLVIKYNNEIITAYYFAMSNGYTEDVQSVFNQQKDYLVSVESQNEETLTSNLVQTVTFTIEEFCSKLNLDTQIISIKNIEYSATNHVTSITINNQKYTGVEFRKLLSLRSTDFEIESNNNEIIITTTGYGHGVGMSQYGAQAMAIEGKSYEDIIHHYYQNVIIGEI